MLFLYIYFTRDLCWRDLLFNLFSDVCVYVVFCINFVYGLISQIGLARGVPNCEKEFWNLLLLTKDFDCLEVGFGWQAVKICWLITCWWRTNWLSCGGVTLFGWQDVKIYLLISCWCRNKHDIIISDCTVGIIDNPHWTLERSHTSRPGHVNINQTLNIFFAFSLPYPLGRSLFACIFWIIIIITIMGSGSDLFSNEP